MMERDSVLIYRSWLKGVQRLSFEKQNGLIRLAIDYGLDGTTPDDKDLDPISEMFLQMVMPQIDANNRRYINGCKGKESGKNGGAPKGNNNASKHKNNPKTTPNQPQDNSETTPNVNVYVHEDDFKKENNKKKNIQPMTEEELAFMEGMKAAYPRVMNMKEPLTLKQYQSIVSEYGADAIKNKLEEMENWVSLSTKVSANLTLRNWLRRDNK